MAQGRISEMFTEAELAFMAFIANPDPLTPEMELALEYAGPSRIPDDQAGLDDDDYADQEDWLAEQVAHLAEQHDADTERRDATLTISYKVRKADAVRIGCIPSESHGFDLVVRSLMANALEAANGDGTGWVSYSRSKVWWSNPDRYRHTPYGYRVVMRAVDWLLKEGLIEDERAQRGDHIRTGLQSRFRATERLLELRFVEFERPAEFDVIRMRDTERLLVRVPENGAVSAMRAEMLDINARLAGVAVGLPEECRPYGPHHVAYENGAGVTCHARVGQPRMYRLFCRKSLELGGRLYGWWQRTKPLSR